MSAMLAFDCFCKISKDKVTRQGRKIRLLILICEAQNAIAAKPNVDARNVSSTSIRATQRAKVQARTLFGGGSCVVEVLLKVGVSITSLPGSIRGILRIQAVGQLPAVGDPVAIRIIPCGTLDDW
jgi:hypothetical protein